MNAEAGLRSIAIHGELQALMLAVGGWSEADVDDYEPLTPKQLRAILCLLEASSLEEGCKRAEREGDRLSLG